MRQDIRIGTSGWHYRHWEELFYPPNVKPKRYLEYYCTRFDAVEINGSFYRLPKPENLKEWRETVPEGFEFAMKASRFLTHMKKLHEPEEPIDRLLSVAKHLGPKLGPILFQLPPWWQVNIERLEKFLSLLPTTFQYAIEFREPSWNQPAVYRLLEKFRIGFCIYELAGYRSPEIVTSKLVYVRLHGPAKAYSGNYSRRVLEGWADKALKWAEQGHVVKIYFDNDQSAFAPNNAMTLRGLLNRPPAKFEIRQLKGVGNTLTVEK
jgi:uncharacterized protein YecE (DUF72 family)